LKRRLHDEFEDPEIENVAWEVKASKAVGKKLEDPLKPKPKPEIKPEVQPKSSMKAKKAFRIVQNEFVRDIKVGDDLSDVPAVYISNLRTEGVID